MEQETIRNFIFFGLLFVFFLFNEYHYSCNDLELRCHNTWSNQTKEEIKKQIEENKKYRIFLASAIFFHICLSI